MFCCIYLHYIFSIKHRAVFRAALIEVDVCSVLLNMSRLVSSYTMHLLSQQCQEEQDVKISQGSAQPRGEFLIYLLWANLRVRYHLKHRQMSESSRSRGVNRVVYSVPANPCVFMQLASSYCKYLLSLYQL